MTTYDDPYNICREIHRAQNDLRSPTFQNQLTRCDLEVLHHSGSGQTSKLVSENAKPQEQLMQQYRRNELIYEQGSSLYLDPQVKNVRSAGMVSILKTKPVKAQRKRPVHKLDFANPNILPKKCKNETKIVPAKPIPTDSYRLADNMEGKKNADKESEEPCHSMSIGGEKELRTRHTTVTKLCKAQTNKRPINRKFVDIRIFFINLINWMEQTNDKKSIKFVTKLKECFEVNFYTKQDSTIQVFGRTLATLNGIPYEYKMKITQFYGDYYVSRSAIASNYEPKKFEPAAVELLSFKNTHKSPEKNVTFYINWIEYHCFDKHIDSQELVPKIAVYPVIMLVPEFFYYLKHKMNYLKSADPNVISSLSLDEELNTIDKILKMDFRRLRTELKDEDFNLIIAFRTHVLSYLQVYYVFKRAYHLYMLCFEQIRIEKLCAVKHIQAFYLCICFTHDFEAIDVCLEGKLRNYDLLKCKDEKKKKDIRKYLEDSFIRRKNIITIALFSYIDAQDSYMKLMFDFDNKSHIMIPAEGFVLVLAMDSNKSKIEKVIQISVQNMTYALRKEALNSISNNTN